MKKFLLHIVIMLLMGFNLSAHAAMTTAQLPDFQFRSTSSYTTVVSRPMDFTPIADQENYVLTHPNLTSPWDDDYDDDDNDNPAGIVDDPLPVGSPLALLFMAVAYLLVRQLKKNKKSTLTD